MRARGELAGRDRRAVGRMTAGLADNVIPDDAELVLNVRTFTEDVRTRVLAAIDRIAVEGDPEAIRFPRAMMHEGLDFSFSGLKTAVINHVRAHPDVSAADVAASFQQAVVDVLITKARRAAREVGAKGLVLGGGVAANSQLREQFLTACTDDGMRGFLPSRAMCTDNAAMIAAAGWHRLRSDGPSSLDTGASPNLRLQFNGAL